MANTTLSPNMGLPVPTVSVDPGPDWAQNINSSLTIIDGHNHTPNSGIPVPVAGLNINADLPFNQNNAVSIRSVRFLPQGSALSLATDLDCLYVVGVDLYYNDGSGNQIRVTQSGSVTGSSGTITGLPSGTASAAYSGGVFSFQSATSTPAQVNGGSIKVTQEVTSGFGVLLQAANTQASNYAMTLPPAIPSSAGYLQMDTSGNLTVQGIVVPGTSPGLVSANGVPGNKTGSFIASGYIGEIVFSAFSSASASGVTPGQFGNLTSITLSAGHWQFTAQANVPKESGQSYAQLAVSLYSSNTTTDHVFGSNVMQIALPSVNTGGYVVGYTDLFTSPTTYYFKGLQDSGSSGWNASHWNGRITAVRIG